MHLSKIWHQQLQSSWLVNYFPSCLNSLPLHRSPGDTLWAGSLTTRLCLPWASCPVVLFTRWIAPVSCFLERGWARVTAPACTSLHSAISRVHPSTESTSSRCDAPACRLAAAQPAALLPYQSFHSCVIALPLGNSSGWKGCGHWCEFLLEKDERRGLNDTFWIKNKTKKTKVTTTPNIKTLMGTLSFSWSSSTTSYTNQKSSLIFDPPSFCPFMNPFIISKQLAKKIQYTRWDVGS